MENRIKESCKNDKTSISVSCLETDVKQVKITLRPKCQHTGNLDFDRIISASEAFLKDGKILEMAAARYNWNGWKAGSFLQKEYQAGFQ